MDISIPVLARGAEWIAVDKPAGLLSVPGKGPEKQDCVASRIRELLRDEGFPVETLPGPVPLDGQALPGIVHRLDMATSGAMVFALDGIVMRDIAAQFAARTVAKTYVAVLRGSLEDEAGTVVLRHRVDLDNRPRQMLDDVHGKEAITRWRVVQRGEDSTGNWTAVVFEPETGRTHQLRIAAAAPRRAGGLGCPIVGDALYSAGPSEHFQGAPVGRLLLHAQLLAYKVHGASVPIESPPSSNWWPCA